MTTPSSGTQARTPLGELLENARLNVLHLTGREVAKRAGISESRWRQVVVGWQSRGGARIPAMPTVRTVIAMAQAVNVDVRTALNAAGVDITDEALTNILNEAKREPQPAGEASPPPEGLDIVYEIKRALTLKVSAESRLSIIAELIDMYEQNQAKDRP